AEPLVAEDKKSLLNFCHRQKRSSPNLTAPHRSSPTQGQPRLTKPEKKPASRTRQFRLIASVRSRQCRRATRYAATEESPRSSESGVRFWSRRLGRRRIARSILRGRRLLALGRSVRTEVERRSVARRLRLGSLVSPRSESTLHAILELILRSGVGHLVD